MSWQVLRLQTILAKIFTFCITFGIFDPSFRYKTGRINISVERLHRLLKNRLYDCFGLILDGVSVIFITKIGGFSFYGFSYLNATKMAIRICNEYFAVLSGFHPQTAFGLQRRIGFAFF